MRPASTPSTFTHFTSPQPSTRVSSGLSHHRGALMARVSFDSGNNSFHYNGPANMQTHHIFQATVPAANVYKGLAAHPPDQVSSIQNVSVQYPAQKRRSSSLDSAFTATEPISGGTGTAGPIISVYGAFTQQVCTTSGFTHNITNHHTASDCAYSHGRFFFAHPASSGAESTAAQEKMPSRKIDKAMGAKVYFNMAERSSCPDQMYKDGLAILAEDAELREVNSSNGSGTNLAPQWSHHFEGSCADNGSKQPPLIRQADFRGRTNVIQAGAIDPMNRSYAAKSTIGPASLVSVGARRNTFNGSINGEECPTSSGGQGYGSNCEPRTAAILHKTGNERSESTHSGSKERVISAHEFMRRLLQAHQVVDELLKSRGLIAEEEFEYLRSWRQRMEREPKTHEQNEADKTENAPELSQQRRTSNASDSGLSMDADSENDLRSSPQLRKSTDNELLLPIESIQVDISKAKKHKNIRFRVIVRKPMHKRIYVAAKIRLKKETELQENEMGSNKVQEAKRSPDERENLPGQVREAESQKTTHAATKTLASIQNNETKQGRAEAKTRTMPKQLKSELITSAGSNSLEANVTEVSLMGQKGKVKASRKRADFMSELKCETVDVCFGFVHKFRIKEKVETRLPSPRCAIIKWDGTTVVTRKKLHGAKKKSESGQQNKGGAPSANLLATAENVQEMRSVKSAATADNRETMKKANTKKGSGMEQTKILAIVPVSPQQQMMEQANPPGVTKSSVLNTKKVELSQSQKASRSSRLFCTINVSQSLNKLPKLTSQLQTVGTILVRSQKVRVARLLIDKEKLRAKVDKQVGIMKINISSTGVQDSTELRKTQKEQQQSHTLITPRYYQKTLRSTAGNKSNTLPRGDRNIVADIRHAREHLKRIDFSRTVGKLQSRASFGHRINEDPMTLLQVSAASRDTSTERSSSISSVMKTKKKVRGTKVDKGFKDCPSGMHSQSTGKTQYSGGGIVTERNNDILDRKMINEYRRTHCIPKPQAKIPVWNVYDERKSTTGIIRNQPKLRHGNLASALPVPYFIRARTPVPIVAAITPSTSASCTSVLRHVVPNPHVSKNLRSINTTFLLDDNLVAVNGSQQQSSNSRFGVILKRVDRAAIQKTKLRGAITESTPKKPWVPKWRRIQRSEEEEEEEAEAVPVVEVTKDSSGGIVDEQEEKQIPTRVPSRRSSQVVTDKDEKDMTEAEKAMLDAKRRQEEEEAAKLQEYEEKRRVEREREEEELRKLKEKKERRKLEREEEERQFQERLRQEEERRKQEEEERKAKLDAEKRKKEEEKRKRQQMLSSQFANPTPGQTGRNFIIPQKSDRADKFGNIVQAKQEMGMTKEQQEEAKRNYLLSVKRTIDFENVSPAELREKIRQLHQRICKLEADKYDLEKRHERQEYDLRELNERQRQVARNKALKKGLDPADTNSRHPPKVSIVSKYDRQIDRRNFKERRAMFENKNAYPCFPNVPPPPTVYEKVILSEDKENEPDDEVEYEEATEQADVGVEEVEEKEDDDEEE